MRLNLDNVISFNENKYVFTKAAMAVIDKIGNVKDYTQEQDSKIVADILNLVLSHKINYSIELKDDEKPVEE